MKLSQKTLITLAIIFNFLIAYGMLLHRQPMNVDGIIYIHAAQSYLSNGIKGAMAVYPWPFYSILIAITSHVSHLSLLSAGLLINAFLTTILVITFIMLIKELGGTILEQALGLLVILIYPYLAHSRYNVLRDFGYYAFFLVSFLYLLRYLRVSNWRNAIGFNMSIIVATLFRIEGIFLLSFAPLIVLLKPDLSLIKKLLATIKLYFPSLIICLGVLAMLFIKGSYSSFNHSTINLGRINDIIFSLQKGPTAIENILYAKKIVIQQLIVSVYGQSYADMFLTGGIIGIFICSLVSTLSGVYSALVLYAICTKKIITDHDSRLALCSYLIIITTILFIFILQQFFLAGRYIVPLCLIAMLVIPFTLSDLIHNRTKNRQSYCILILASVALLYSAVDAFGQFGTSKTYIIDAGLWLKANTPTQTRLYSNDPQLVFYSDRAGTPYLKTAPPNIDWLADLKQIDLTHYDYVALDVNRDEQIQERQAEAFLKLAPIHRWQNNSGDSIILFKIAAPQADAQQNDPPIQQIHCANETIIPSSKTCRKGIHSVIDDFLSAFHP